LFLGKFTFAISSPDEFLLKTISMNYCAALFAWSSV